MRKLVLALTLFLTPISFASTPPANPADFPITVHVVFSHQSSPSATNPAQRLDAVVDGQQIELFSGDSYGVLAPGDYKAQLATTSYIPKHLDGYDIFRIYRFLLPDGKTRDFFLVGLGPTANGNQPPSPGAPTNP
jgi:hypothetical protein